MKKIVVYDINNTGHHWFYNYNILKSISKENKVFYFTNDINNEQIADLTYMGVEVEKLNIRISGNIIARNFALFRTLLGLFKYIKETMISKVLLVCFDPLVLVFLLFAFQVQGINILCTLHWLPRRRLKLKLLKIYSKKDNIKFIVHDELIKSSLINNGIDAAKIVVISYPFTNDTIIDKARARDFLNLERDKTLLLYFGGTRYDKGLDILLDALKYVDKDCQLLIAGKEETFSRDFIKKKIQENRLDEQNIIMHLKYINDEEVKYYFSAADILVLPYRKIFMGQSGPLTEGIKYNKLVIAPDWFVLGQTIKKYNCGLLYKPEDIEDLSKKITYAIENYEELIEEYKNGFELFKQERSLDNFVRRYTELL